MYDEMQSGELSEEEFKKRFPSKSEAPIKRVIKKAVKKFISPKPKPPYEPDIEPDDDFIETPVSRDQVQQMRQSEEEVRQRQVVEYHERDSRIPETQAEMDNKLLEIDARMAVKKELMMAKDDSGVIRNTAIQLEEEYPEIFTPDIVKGNFGDQESACIFGNGSIINAMKSIGQAKGFPFVDASRFNKNQMDLMINISRGRNGFSAVLVKTDKHVSEGVVSHVQKAFMEKKEKKWGVF